MVQLLLAVLKRSDTESFTVRDFPRNVFPTDASIVNGLEPKRLVCMSPRELPLMLVVIDHPRDRENVLLK